MVVSKSVVYDGHVIDVDINEPDEKVYYDHREMSSLKAGAGKHAFEVEEDRERIRYELFLTYDMKRDEGNPYTIDRGYGAPASGSTSFSLIWGATVAVANILAKRISAIKLAIIRNGKIIYNDGVPVPNILKGMKKSKKLGGIDESERTGICTRCKMKVAISGSRYCPNCSSTLEWGLITTALPWKDGNPDKPNVLFDENYRQPHCTVCDKNLEHDDLLAFCPFCGRAAHRTELIGWLQLNGTCPKCHQQIDPQLLSRYLSSHP